MLPASISRFASSNACSRSRLSSWTGIISNDSFWPAAFDLTAIGFGNYRSPQSIGSLEGADGEPFVVSSAVSIGWHGATGAACPCWQLGFASSQMADGDDDAARSPAVFSMGCLWVCPSL